MRGQRKLIGNLIQAAVVLGGLAWILGGCGNKDWKLHNQPPKLAAMGAQSVTEGQSITFAVSATDEDQDDHLTMWVDNQPDNSQFADSGDGRGRFSFYPNYNQHGTLHPVFKVSDGHSVDSEVVAITIVDVAYTHHAGIITQNETWAAANNPHLVAGDIEIDSGAVVTIEPGCIVYFIEGRRIRVGYSSPGGLVADGTPEQKIRFTSMMPDTTPGIWDGLTFSANCLSSSILDNCIIEFGGGNGYGDVYVDGGAVSITNCTIRRSATNGIFFGGEGNAPSFAGNMITANVAYPVAVSCNQLGRLGGSSLTGNAKDTLIVRGALVNTNARWDTLGVPLRITEVFQIAGGATLTIVPGSCLAFDKSIGIKVGSTSAGTLVADGTSQKPILFTSSQGSPLPGAWEGLAFYGSAGSGCSLADCIVEYGGQKQSGSIYIKDSEVSIRTTTVRKGKQYGVFFAGDGRFSSFENNVITDNALSPVSISAKYAGRLPNSTAYTGNGSDRIIVSGATLTEDATWANLGIPYLVSDTIFVDNGRTLTIAAGDTVDFNGDAMVLVGKTGPAALIADGSDSPIVFTAADTTRLWSGIHFLSHTQESSVLKNCTISYAGGAKTGVTIWLTNCRMTINGCRISNSGGVGIRFEGISYALNFEGNTITANKQYPVSIDCNYFGMLPPTNDYTGNSVSGFEILGSTISDSATWGNPGVPLVIGSDLTISSGVQLTLSPNIVLKFSNEKRLAISKDAALIADGTAGRITLTNNPTPDILTPDWRGLVFLPGASSSSILKNCYIHKGGADQPGTGKLPGSVHVDSCSITVTDCYIDSSSSNGIYLAGTACLNEFHGNTITNCNSYPVRIEARNAECLNAENSFTGNFSGGADFIRVGLEPLGVSVTWPKLPIPYFLDSLPAVTAGTLTLSPGVKLVIGKRGPIRFDAAASLIANGTETDSITFISRDTSSMGNNWGYILLQGTGGSASSLTYCIVDHGGNFSSNPKGMITLVNCTPTLINCRISNSRSYGIYREGTPSLSRTYLETNNSFFHNGASGNDHIYPAGP